MNSKAQMRNQLLQSDIGNIDLSHEVPNGQPPQQQYQQTFNRPVQPQYYANRYPQEEPERRAYSLNQKSISGFFRNRGGKLPHRKGKYDSSKDEEEEVMVDGDMSTMTFNDIRTSQNRGGERYGHGSDTAPIIPTLVTQSHNNMNNVEYRKHMTAQRKYAMNAMARQQKPDARAMSLQGYGNPYRMHPQYQASTAQDPYGNSRANSLVHPPPQFQRGGFPPYGTPGGPPGGPPNGLPNRGPMPNGPRAMSLMTPYSRPPNMRPPNEFHQPSQQMHRQQGLSSESLRPEQPYRQPPENLPGLREQPYRQGPPPENLQGPVEHFRQPGPSSEYIPGRSEQPYRQGLSPENLPGRSEKSHRQDPSSEHLSGPAEQFRQHGPSSENLAGRTEQPYRQGPTSENLSGRPEPQGQSLDFKAHRPGHSAQLNVLQLSAPQQNDLKEKERSLAEREKELKEKERLIKEQETQIKHDLEQKHKQIKPQLLHANVEDINLDPSPTLQNGLKSLTVNDRDVPRDEVQNRVSMGTFVSAFSASPEKRRNLNPSGMYQLEKHDNSAFVTAQEFPQGTENRSPEKSEDVEEGNSTLTNIDVSEIKGTSDATSDQRRKRSSLIRAKDFLRKLSSHSLKDSDAQLPPSRASVASIPSSETLQGTAAKRELSGQVVRKNKAEDELARSTEPNNDPDSFIFDNTVGKPYVPSFATNEEVAETNKFKTITISGEQLNILTENKELMSELTLVSMELAESIKRETILEEQIRTSSDPSQAEAQLSLADFEIELRKKSSKIVELIQQLNNERLKRFIAEEQVLLFENEVKPSSLELVNKISELQSLLETKDNEISKLKDQLL